MDQDCSCPVVADRYGLALFHYAVSRSAESEASGAGSCTGFRIASAYLTHIALFICAHSLDLVLAAIFQTD